MEREFLIESFDEMCDIWCGNPEEDEDIPFLVQLNPCCVHDISDDECRICEVNGRINGCKNKCPDFEDVRD